jgi:hypothetical protein
MGLTATVLGGIHRKIVVITREKYFKEINMIVLRRRLLPRRFFYFREGNKWLN